MQNAVMKNDKEEQKEKIFADKDRVMKSSKSETKYKIRLSIKNWRKRDEKVYMVAAYKLYWNKRSKGMSDINKLQIILKILKNI